MKNDPIHELTQTTQHNERRIGSLENTLRVKTGNLSDILKRLGKLETKVGEHSVGLMHKKIGDIDTKLGKTETRLDRESARIVKLRRDVDTLHGMVRLSSGLPQADYDTWPEISSEMIELIRERLAAKPVSEAEIERLRRQQEKARDERLRWDRSLEEAVVAVRALTGLPAGAERLWRKQARTWLAFRGSGERPLAKEEHARREHDEATRVRQAATAAEANAAAADEEACGVIRERVVHALAQSFMPPRWFESALGLFPPKEPGHIKPWLDVATRLIRYRLLAGVTDELFPYGDRPPDSKLAGERDEVERLCDGQRR
ncbi:hypothetical protein GCM10011609_10610 [Lentzea pudingi]|uniref:Uncharacterized protein n=1 Tax=Lentzea pudingi TaxID=1789439 RepID=A0ABQ2HEG1_9PSEU|nr:hypothetical protein [Lentzea pudingi]GGM76601.1 hypothetical protein GCM10011609_10610 [Lentzea pudingi]